MMSGLEYMDYLRAVKADDDFDGDLQTLREAYRDASAAHSLYKTTFVHHTIYTTDNNYRMFRVKLSIYIKSGSILVVSAEEVTDIDEMDAFFLPGMGASRVAEKMKGFIYEKK